MILVYTHKVTPRLRYIFKHIFVRIIGVSVSFTDRVDEFVAFNGAKMSYTKVPLGGEFFIKSNALLFEQGLNDIEINIQQWDEVPCFFNCGAKSIIPFDIFAASFYLISRYEEYLPHVKDLHGRFTAAESLAFKNDFLEKPVVDIWAFKLLEIINHKFTNFQHKHRTYDYVSTIDIDNAYAYKHKSFIRSIGGLVNDFFRLKFKSFWNRSLVLINLKKDPYNTFDAILRLQKKYSTKTLFFFLVANYTAFDTNVSSSKRPFRLLIKQIVDYATVGLHPSYFSMNDIQLLKNEKERLEDITNMPMMRSRQHYLRFNLPETYQNLIDLEITEDYSMGYASHVGFRAGTCTPFYFYDLDFEIQTPLKVIPFALMDTTLNDYMNLTPKQALGRIRDLQKEVKAVNGLFVSLFHNESLSNYTRWKGWSRLYESMLKIANS